MKPMSIQDMLRLPVTPSKLAEVQAIADGLLETPRCPCGAWLINVRGSLRCPIHKTELLEAAD